MAAPLSPRRAYTSRPTPARHQPHPVPWWGVCGSCEFEMEQDHLEREWNARPPGERIAIRWARARARVREVAALATMPPF